MQSPTTDIHGHEVMRMMVESGIAYDEAGLEAAMVEKFGSEARFCTCSAQGMTAHELIQFLAAKGKFIPSASGFTTAPDKICDH
ncbi:MAG: YecH family protein [Planctomycetales bacterium]|nr:YecH family protein [Planctomycetales bacterium]